MVGGAPRSGLFGRERELDELRATFDDASAGRSRIALVVGEPGIGKTRLAQAFTDDAGARGAVTAWGRAWEAGGAPPFWPWIEALRGLCEHIEGAAMPALSAERWAALAQLLPELARPTSRPLDALAPDAARFRLFDAVAAWLQGVARKQPVVLVLDDMHAADVGSLALLHFVSRSVRDAKLVVVATYRDVEARLSAPVREALAQVAREGRYLALSRLTRHAVAQWIAAVSPRPSGDLVDALWGRTEGNPLFMVETMRLLRDRNAHSLDRGVPDGVREAIRARLRELSAPTRVLLETAAVFGRRFDLGHVAAIMGIDLVEARDRLAEAARADVLVAIGPDRGEFTHILLRDALYDELSAARRSELHAAALRVLAPDGAAMLPEQLAEIVHHAFAAIPLVAPNDAIAWARRASARAIETLAFDNAVDWLDRAIATLPRGAEHDAARCDLLLTLAEAQVGAGRVTAARESSRLAAVIARQLDDAERLAQSALGYGRVYALSLVDGDLVALLEEALAKIPRDASPMRARLLARLAAALQPAPDPDPPMDVARDAIALARTIGDPATHIEVLVAAGSALCYFAEPDERIVLARELVTLADAANDRVHGLRGRGRLAVDHLERGEVALADASVREYERLAQTIALPSFRWMACALRAMLAIHQGRFAQAEESMQASRAIASQIDDATAPLTLAMQRVGLLRAAAREDELVHIAPEAIGRVNRGADVWFARSFAAAVAKSTGDLDELRTQLRVLAEDISAMRRRVMLTFVAEGCVALDDKALAAAVAGPLSIFATRNHSWGPGLVCEGPVTHPLGNLAALLGDRDAAVGQLRDAHARTDAMHSLPQRARVEIDLAAVLIDRNAPGDRDDARRLLEAAARSADALPLPSLRARIAELDARAGSIPASAPPPDVLRAPTFAMRCEGQVWAISGDVEIRLKDSRGLRILARLVAEPGREFHVTDLVAPDGQAGHIGDAGDALDRTAIAKYRARLLDLREDQREAERFGDTNRVERRQAEIDAIAGELARAVGLGGRARKAGSVSEKARVNVRQRLRDAIDKITEHSPALGRHLRGAVRTGTFCSYEPAGR